MKMKGEKPTGGAPGRLRAGYHSDRSQALFRCLPVALWPPFAGPFSFSADYVLLRIYVVPPPAGVTSETVIVPSLKLPVTFTALPPRPLNLS